MYVNKYETETELLINKQVFINIYIVVTDVSARARGHFNIKKYTSNCPVRKTSAMTLNLLNVF